MTDDAFLQLFNDCTLPASNWTHHAHVRMAWLTLSRLPHRQALEQIRAGIQTYNARVLKKEMAYHETITLAFTHLIAVAMSQLPSDHSLDDLQIHEPMLFDRKLSILFRYYRPETLKSDLARNHFVPPDVSPLPPLAM